MPRQASPNATDPSTRDPRGETSGGAPPAGLGDSFPDARTTRRKGVTTSEIVLDRERDLVTERSHALAKKLIARLALCSADTPQEVIIEIIAHHVRGPLHDLAIANARVENAERERDEARTDALAWCGVSIHAAREVVKNRSDRDRAIELTREAARVLKERA